MYPAYSSKTSLSGLGRPHCSGEHLTTGSLSLVRAENGAASQSLKVHRGRLTLGWAHAPQSLSTSSTSYCLRACADRDAIDLLERWARDARSSGEFSKLPNEGKKPVPALPPYLIVPNWQQFSALLPEREVNHPLGCHRPRIPDRVIFEKLIEVLVFGCAYHRIADESCSATTLRDRRDEWIEWG